MKSTSVTLSILLIIFLYFYSTLFRFGAQGLYLQWSIFIVVLLLLLSVILSFA